MVLKAMKWFFFVFCFYLASLFFHEQRLPGEWAVRVFEMWAPTNLVLHVDSVAFDLRKGIRFNGVRLHDASMADPTRLLAGARQIAYDPYLRHLRVEKAVYTRLPDSYYAPGNLEKNARVEGEMPDWGTFSLELIEPDILAVKPARLDGEVEIRPHRVDFRKLHLTWPNEDNRHMTVDGYCFVDLDSQEVYGTVNGLAKQSHIRPLLVAIDVPVALPYMDGFTDVPEPCKAGCTWKVDLVRNDLDLWLELHPVLGKYNGVLMQKADGIIHLHNYTRGTCLNYVTTIGTTNAPLVAVDTKGEELRGSVTVTGMNGYNVVDVEAKGAQPLADILRIGGFTGDYVGSEVIGRSECKLQFRFPRAMTNNYEVLNGKGHVVIRDGQLMRMKGFKGLLDAMPDMAPAVTWFSDTTQASGDYTIENGIVKTDGIYVEGSLFSIKMYGSFDSVKNAMDFLVRVQFTKQESLMGKFLHPLAWPFTKLLLEFRLTGTPEHPIWTYVSVIDRVLEAVR